ncbi:MAG TPA: hypothetical protein VN615_10515 [Gaiellales bacterium]|nr:hypothetical protein [Gaiellales bacterium]
MRRYFTLLIALVAVLVAAAPAAGSSGGTATATLTGSPNPVTAGTTVAYDTTFHNGTSHSLPNTTLDAPAPAGFSIVSVTSSGSCTKSAGDATCSFGPLGPGESASATVIMNVPSATGDVNSSVTWTTGDGDEDSDDITLPASTTVTVKAPSTDVVAQYVLPAGGTVSTGSTTSATNPQSTTADVPSTPNGVAVTLAEVDATSPQDACGPGATCVGQISVITVDAPPFPVTDPLHFAILVNSTELPRHMTKKQALKLPVFHDGVLVPSCTGAPGVASPDPCVAARKLVKLKHCPPGQFQVEFDVNSSTNGRWRT